MTEPLNDTIIHRLFKPITNSIHLDSIFITSAYSPSIDNKKKTHRTKSRFRPTTWHHEERNHHTNEIATHRILDKFSLHLLSKPFSTSPFRWRPIIPQTRNIIPVITIMSHILLTIIPYLILSIICRTYLRNSPP